jgi:hypothetical protein
MDDVKLGEKSKIGILNPTHVNQASHTVNLRNEMKRFNKEVADLSKNTRARVSLYIAKTMHAFVKGAKTTIKIPNFFKVSFTCTFSCALKYNCLS